MPQVTIARIAVSNPMGAENYQRHIISRAADAVAAYGREWSVREVVVRSLRSPLPGTRRLPLGWLGGADPRARRVLGRLTYPRGGVVHRMNLELPPGPAGNVVTLHDVVAWECSDEAEPVRAAIAELRAADAVICVSEYTAQRAVELFGIRDPQVIPNGVDPDFLDAVAASDDELARLGVRRPFVLTAGGASARKNLGALAQAWPLIRRARPELSLVLTGTSDPRRTSLFEPLPGTRLVGRLSDDLIPRLIAAASAVIVPSLIEGFGLPALEGMAAGVPVVAARTSSLPEIVGDDGILVDPTAVGLTDGVLQATADDGVGRELGARGRIRASAFTWERSAAGHATVWARVAGLGIRR